MVSAYYDSPLEVQVSIYNLLMCDSEFERLIGSQPPFARGTSREAFDVPDDALVVIKKQIITFPGANLMEWQIWHAVQKTVLKDCFGECLAISETGRYLMMERLDNIGQPEWPMVPKVPVWLNDKKPSAFGKAADGRIKVRDYALVDLDPGLDVRTFQVSWANSNI